MSNYSAPTFHPITGKLEQAAWMDDYYGHYEYGVRFPDGSVHEAYVCEQVGPKASDLIGVLQARVDELEREVKDRSNETLHTSPSSVKNPVLFW